MGGCKNVGGLAGVFVGGSAIDNYSSANVTGGEVVGGLVGLLVIEDNQVFQIILLWVL